MKNLAFLLSLEWKRMGYHFVHLFLESLASINSPSIDTIIEFLSPCTLAQVVEFPYWQLLNDCPSTSSTQ